MALFGRFSHSLSCQMLIKLEDKKIIFVIAKIGNIGKKTCTPTLPALLNESV
jgi:hypothetical protein